MAEGQPTPQIIRSQRNRARNAPPQSFYELSATPAAHESEEPGKHASSFLQAQAEQQGLHGHPGSFALDMIAPEGHLGYFSTSALIINKVVGTGIFVQPATVLALAGSKGASLMLWLFGSLVAWAGLTVYLEYGIRFPLTGGELYYIDFVWLKPKLLFTYMYSVMFVILSGSQANALQFGASVITASTPLGTKIDARLQKFFAVCIVGVICLLQTYSRNVIVHLNNAIAIYKLLLLSLITVAGWCAIGGLRTASARSFSTPYGISNLQNVFDGTSNKAYGFGIALLVIQRAFLGYENANFVLEEVRRPPGDESRVFRRTAKATMLALCFFYVLVNVAFFAACSSDELLETGDVTGLFFAKVFGPSDKTRTASGILIAIAAAGNIMSYTFAAVRVKQEIARMGIIPYPEFWARSTHWQTPGPALLLHFLFTSLFVLCAPISSANGYLVISTLFVYARTWIAILLGLGLLAAPHLNSFSKADVPWKPIAWLGRWTQVPLTTLYVLANGFMLVLYWFPSDLQKDLHTKSVILPSYVGPLVGTVFYVAGAVYWVWDLKVLPKLGWRLEVLQERQEGWVVYMSFQRTIEGFASGVCGFLQAIWSGMRRLGKRHNVGRA